MQRYSLNMKGGTYTQGPMYHLVPILRQQVVPGQTVNLDVEVSLKSAALTKNVSTPCIMSTWFFYVPHRLVWDEWTSFISKEDGAPAFPTTTDSGTYFFDKAIPTSPTINYSPLYRRAYKLIYNEYFGSEPTGINYADITDDSVVSINKTRNPEQWSSRLVLDSTTDDPEFNVVASSIPLNEFYRQMMNARSTQRSQMTGNKYVDTLARMGVDATWMIAERPEFLGTKSQMVGPQLTAVTSDTDTGTETARFQSKIMCSIKQKHFAEHGYVVGVASMRPIIIQPDRSAPDGQFTTIDDFYSADNLQTRDTVESEFTGFVGSTAYQQRFGYLKNGSWLSGNDSSAKWYIENAGNSFSLMVYPNDGTLPISNELGGGANDFAATTSFTMSGKTPVPQRVA